MAQNHSAPILELSTLAPERPRIRIDGVDWEIAVQADFGLLDTEKLKRLHKPFSEYYEADDATDEVVGAMVAALGTFVLLVVRGATPELIQKLTDPQQLEIVGVFTNAAGWTTSPEVETPAPIPPTPRRRSTSGKSSRGSNDSTDR